MQGRLRKLNVTAKYGFIKAGSIDYFFHRDDFNGHWDDLVTDFNADRQIELTFTAANTEKGPRAQEVHVMSVTGGKDE